MRCAPERRLMAPRARCAPVTVRPERQEAALTTFRELGVLPETCDALEAVGITDAFAIQELTLPVALAGNDVIGQAKTGTGKTLGFGIPLLQRLVAPHDPDVRPTSPHAGKPQALVVVPTRELCIQVTSDLDVAGELRGVRDPRRLRRPRLRAAGRGAAPGHRRRRRHPRPPDRPGATSATSTSRT